MKISKIIIFLNVSLMPIIVFSQLTLDYPNFISVGDSIVEHYDNTPDKSIKPGEEGENITWDFGLLKSNSTDTLSILPVKNALFAKDFEPTNIAICLASTDSTAMVLQQTENELKHIGSGYYLNNKKIISKQNRTLIKYPLNYLDEYYKVIKKEKILYKDIYNKDSIKVLSTIEHAYKVDAWGDLKLPTGVFFSLRIKREWTITESYYRFDNYVWSKYDQKKYPNVTFEWWTNDKNAKHYIAYLVMDATNENVIHSSFIPAIPFEENVEKIKSVQMLVYPNPAQNYISFNLPEKNVYVNIYSINGQLVYEKFHPLKNNKITISNFSNGIYIIVVRNTNSNIVGKSKFIKY